MATTTSNYSFTSTASTLESLPSQTDCSHCLNELCIPEDEYLMYRSWVSVDTFEMVLIALNIVVFLAGILGNLLVRSFNYLSSKVKILMKEQNRLFKL